MKVSELDTENAIHDSLSIREICGSPGDESWSRFRRSVEIKGKKRKLSDYQAFLLFVRSYWRRVCKEAGEDYVRSPNRYDVARVAQRWCDRVSADPTVLFQQIIEMNTFKGSQLPQVLQRLTGKSLSESTVRRKCLSVGMKFSRRKTYDRKQVTTLAKVLKN